MIKRHAIVVLFLAGCLTAALAIRGQAENVIETLVKPGALVQGHAKAEKDCNNCHKSFSWAAQDGLCLVCHKDIAADMREKTGLHGKRKTPAEMQCRHCHTDHKGPDADIVNLDRETFDHTMTDFELKGRHQNVLCDGCHKAGKKFSEAPGTCFDCHKTSDPHKRQLGEKCDLCHEEKSWKETRSFDHAKTNFALTGAHERVTCNACHAGERYKGTPVTCIECHREDDKHKGLYGAKCDTCHKTAVWSEIAFDHDKDTKYPLLAKHASVACEKCHTEDPKKVKTPVDCLSCHIKDDVHKTRLGKRCQDCHNESGWKIGVLFDHAKTKFALKGKHADAKCADCHKAKIYDPVELTCVSCHAKKDVHLGRLGPKCEQCHNDVDWKDWHFDHAKEGRYPLTGAHAKTGCYACHAEKAVKTAKLPTDCFSCHKKDDRHKGAFGKGCDKCHSTATFTSAVIRR